MSSGARVQTAYATQTDKDVKPTTGWAVLANSSNGLNNSMTLTDSDLITGGRIKQSGMVTGGEVTGDIASELMFGAFDDLLAGAFWSAWELGTDPDPDTLEIGTDRTMFAITKDFQDINVYHYFAGCHVSTLNLEVNTDAIASITFGFMGLGYEHSKTASFAVTPSTAVQGKKASGLSIGTILIDGTDVGVCVEAFSFSLDNQAEIQKCLGNNKYGGNVLAMIANITGSMTIAYSQKAHDILSSQIDGTTMSLEIPIEFSATEKYVLKIPKFQVSGDIPAPSGTEKVTAEVSYTVVDESPVLERHGA